jgi:hypothetical protein
MRISRKKFILWFLCCGYALHFVSKLVLNQAPDALWASPAQQVWQQHISTILSPLRVVLVGPVSWLMQDPDPPPPFRIILFAVYWSLFAMALHYLLSRPWQGRGGALRS